MGEIRFSPNLAKPTFLTPVQKYNARTFFQIQIKFYCEG